MPTGDFDLSSLVNNVYNPTTTTGVYGQTGQIPSQTITVGGTGTLNSPTTWSVINADPHADRVKRYKDHVNRLVAIAIMLMRRVEHKEGCAARTRDLAQCNCGLDDIQTAITEMQSESVLDAMDNG